MNVALARLPDDDDDDGARARCVRARRLGRVILRG
jgi:hypothetical protein